jgi:hypothetical protein
MMYLYIYFTATGKYDVPVHFHIFEPFNSIMNVCVCDPLVEKILAKSLRCHVVMSYEKSTLKATLSILKATLSMVLL